MNTTTQSFFDSVIVYFCQFVIQRLKPWPFVRAEDVDECWEIETGVVADLFVLRSFGCIYVEIYNFGIDLRSFFESADEWANVLESGTSYQF